MSAHSTVLSEAASGRAVVPNGPGAAALLAAGIGCSLLGVLAVAGDKIHAAQQFFIFSKPTGPLSGVTTCTIVGWVVAWVVLHARWSKRNVALGRVTRMALLLLVLGLLLTFPPFADLF